MGIFSKSRISAYLLNQVAPLANEIDSNPEALLHALKGLGELGVLALRVPHHWGGQEVTETFNSFQELVARYSGALAFLQTQHQSAGGMLVASTNSSLQEEYLPHMSHGKMLVGVGFSHIRRPGKPSIVALPVSSGYQLNGEVPWITGWGFFNDFIIAATLSDGSTVFGMLPFQETHQKSGGSITFSPPAQLAAITSTNTVTASLREWFLPSESVVFIKPAGWIHENDQKNFLHATPLITGCAFAGLDIIESAAQTKSLPAIASAFESLLQELNDCRSAIALAQPDVPIAQRLQLRAWAIELTTRIAHAAITVSSGAANFRHHAAQRVYREAIVYTVSGQTRDLMAATLERLTRPSSENQFQHRAEGIYSAPMES